jgi:hypothetical protein
MRLRALAAAALAAALASSAFAQDGGSVPPGPPAPPAPGTPKPAAVEAKPAKHENKVSDAAKAAWESMGANLYDPVALGLKEFQGKASLRMEFPGMGEAEGMPPMTVEFTVGFKAPQEVTVEASTDNPMLSQAAGQLKDQVRQLVTMGVGRMTPSNEEYDADLEEKDGAKTLVLKMYKDNEPQGTMRLSLGEASLPSKGILTATDPNSGMEMTMEFGFQYARVGEKYRLHKQTISHPMMPSPMETTISYGDAGGFEIFTAFETTGVMGSGTMSYRFTELTANGKKVEVAAPAKKAEAPATPTPPAPPAPPAPPKEEKKPE